jgi:hypothetical protein
MRDLCKRRAKSGEGQVRKLSEDLAEADGVIGDLLAEATDAGMGNGDPIPAPFLQLDLNADEAGQLLALVGDTTGDALERVYKVLRQVDDLSSLPEFDVKKHEISGATMIVRKVH